MRDRLDPGESISSVTWGLRKKRTYWWNAGDLDHTSYYLVLTDRRVWIIGLARVGRRTDPTVTWHDAMRPDELIWGEPFAGLAVEKFESGRIYVRLDLRRLRDRQAFRFQAPTATGEYGLLVVERLTAVANTLNRARTGAPGPG